jgi:hypothetical protein
VLSVAPFTFPVLEVIENAAFASMLARYPAISPGLVAATSPVTMVKLAAFVITLPTLVLGVTAIGVRWLRGRRAGRP